MSRLGIALAGMAFVASVSGAVAVALNGSQPTTGLRSSSTTSTADRSSTGPGDHLPVKEPGEPCDEARHASSVSGLATRIPIWAPEGERLTDAWTCGGVPVLMYGDVEVSFESGFAKVDPAKKFPRMVATDDGRIQTINGRLAYVHPADQRGPRNGVWILVGDYSVGLIAKPQVGIDRVLQVAREIQIPASASN